MQESCGEQTPCNARRCWIFRYARRRVVDAALAIASVARYRAAVAATRTSCATAVVLADIRYLLGTMSPSRICFIVGGGPKYSRNTD